MPNVRRPGWRESTPTHGYGDDADCLCGRNFAKVRGLREHLTKMRQAVATDAFPCGSCGEPGPYTITLGGAPMPACLRHMNVWRTPPADYTCPTACLERSHPGREHHAWIADRTDYSPDDDEGDPDA